MSMPDRGPLPKPLATLPLLLLSVTVAAQTVAGEIPMNEDGSDVTPRTVRTAYIDGRDQEVVLMVDRALSVEPDAELRKALPELRFWRGAALRRLGRHEEALVALEGASRAGFRAPEVRLERALAFRALGQAEEAKREYQDAERLLPDEDERRARFLERWGEAAKESPLQVKLTPEVGYDTNVIGIDKDTPLAADEIDRDSFYWGGLLAAKYHVLRKPGSVLSLDLRTQARSYSEEPDLSFTETVLSATGRYALAEWVEFEVRGSLAEAYLHDDGHLRTMRTVAPALLLHLSPSLKLRAFGDWTSADYYAADLAVEQDRDGVIERGGIAVGFDLGDGWSAGPSVSFMSYEADGDDFDHGAWTLAFALTTGKILGCVVAPSVSYTWADYRNLNSVTSFSEKREDRIVLLSITVTLRGLEESIGYAPSFSVSFTDHGSNIDAYDYERWEPRLELALLNVAF